MRKLYIAHPLFGPKRDALPQTEQLRNWQDPAANFERYLRWCAFASELGYTVVSWAHHYAMERAGMLKDKPAEFYLDRDFDLIRCSDELWVCGPPSISSGVRAEIAVAIEINIPVECVSLVWHDTPWDGTWDSTRVEAFKPETP